VKKCNDAVRDHKYFSDDSERFRNWLKEAERKAESCKGASGSRKELEEKAEILKTLYAQKPTGAGLLNGVVLAGEKLAGSTGPEGINAASSNIEELNGAFEGLYDGLSASEREIQEKLLRFVRSQSPAYELGFRLYVPELCLIFTAHLGGLHLTIRKVSS